MRQNLNWVIAVLLVLGTLCTGCTAPGAEVDRGSSIAAEDVSPILQEADTLYKSGDYAVSLDLYLTAMEKDAKNVDARIGVSKCQIEMGNYDLADLNLSMAQQIDSSSVEFCELYLKLSQMTGDPYYARTAVNLAARYGHESILENVPTVPTIDHESESYSERIFLTITCDDPDAEVYVSLSNDQNTSYSLHNQKYSQPIMLIRGENTVSAYSIKNGIPSETVTKTYSVDYDSFEVHFKEPLVEEIVRQELGKDSGPITNYECEQITEFNWSALMSVYTNYNEYQNLKISSLEDLQYLPSVQNFSIQNQTEITDFSPLLNCPMIYQAALSKCGLKDAEVVKYLPNLSHLNLYHNEISDFSALENNPELYGLYIYDNDPDAKIDDILRSNPQLGSLGIDDTQLADYSVLTELEDIEHLYIYGISNVDYTAISELTDLEGLTLSYNYERGEYNKSISNLSFLPKMQGLQSLTLNGVDNASDLVYISQLPYLTSLSLYSCNATSDQAAMKALIQALPNCSITY